MTPEEVGKALGEGWERRGDAFKRGSVAVRVTSDDWCGHRTGWMVAFGRTRLDPVSPEHAVAVAHLLVAAERIAGGAALATVEDERYRWRAGEALSRPAVVRRGEFMYPHEARTTAIDLLRAAAEAESTPTARREAGEG